MLTTPQPPTTRHPPRTGHSPRPGNSTRHYRLRGRKGPGHRQRRRHRPGLRRRMRRRPGRPAARARDQADPPPDRAARPARSPPTAATASPPSSGTCRQWASGPWRSPARPALTRPQGHRARPRLPRLVKWRTGCEGRISYLKRSYGWDRTRLDGREGARELRPVIDHPAPRSWTESSRRRQKIGKYDCATLICVAESSPIEESRRRRCAAPRPALSAPGLCLGAARRARAVPVLGVGDLAY